MEAGYWSLYHYDPAVSDRARTPFVLDSKEPSNGFREFLLSEVRYSLGRQFPERAEMLYEKAEADAKARRSNYTSSCQQVSRTHNIRKTLEEFLRRLFSPQSGRGSLRIFV